MDQTLPWEEAAGPVGAASLGTQAEPDPVDLALAAIPSDEAEQSPPADRTSCCPAGHPYDEENTYVSPRGWRSCRACQRASKRRRRALTGKSLTAEQRVLRSRLGAYRLHATHDPKETTKKAREAFAGRFEREVDPDRVLAPAERARRADAAKRAYFTRLALRSAQARRRAG